MLKYIPKYVRQESDLEYGEKVTHENFNEKLNLNTTQGDYNTAVLEKLFNSEDIEDTYRIPYLDKVFNEHISHMTEYDESLSQIVAFVKLVEQVTNGNATTIQHIITGEEIVAKATEAERIHGITSAPVNAYYGKNVEGSIGFFQFPDFIAAVNPNETTAEVTGIYFLPQANSVTEDMLSENVRTKLNLTGLTDYLELTSKPSINGVVLENNKSLVDLGIQPVGDYVTDIWLQTNYPDNLEMNTAIANAVSDVASSRYTKTETDNKITSSINTALTNYSTKAQTPVIQIGSSFSGTPKNGDILVTV